MKRIVLPGTGTPVTFTPKEDSTIGIRTGGRLITITLEANVSTKIEFLNSISVTEVDSRVRSLAA